MARAQCQRSDPGRAERQVIAAYKAEAARYDALLVNPVRDGLNPSRIRQPDDPVDVAPPFLGDIEGRRDRLRQPVHDRELVREAVEPLLRGREVERVGRVESMLAFRVVDHQFV